MNGTSGTRSSEAGRDRGKGLFSRMTAARRGRRMGPRPGRLLGVTLLVVLAAGYMATAVAAGVPAWEPGRRSTAQEPMAFQCPRAYLGVRQDLLPTHWEIVTGRAPLRLKASQVQRGELLCIYQDERGRSVGTVRRLAPGGYKCISDGAGRFRCRPLR